MSESTKVERCLCSRFQCGECVTDLVPRENMYSASLPLPPLGLYRSLQPGWMETTNVSKSSDGRVAVSEMFGAGDPGYYLTARE